MSEKIEAMLDEIIEHTAKCFGVRQEFLFRASRRHRVAVLAKEVIISIAYERGWWSYPDLARRFNAKRHTTIITARKSANRRIASGGTVAFVDDVPVTMSELIAAVGSGKPCFVDAVTHYRKGDVRRGKKAVPA